MRWIHTLAIFSETYSVWYINSIMSIYLNHFQKCPFFLFIASPRGEHNNKLSSLKYCAVDCRGGDCWPKTDLSRSGWACRQRNRDFLARTYFIITWNVYHHLWRMSMIQTWKKTEQNPLSNNSTLVNSNCAFFNYSTYSCYFSKSFRVFGAIIENGH